MHVKLVGKSVKDVKHTDEHAQRKWQNVAGPSVFKHDHTLQIYVNLHSTYIGYRTSSESWMVMDLMSQKL